MSHQHYSDKVKKMKSKRKMDSNGPERRWIDSRDGKFTPPTQGLKNVFFGRGNNFKTVLDALSQHLGELELSKLDQVDYDSPVCEKWQTPDCSHLDTVCTVNMDSHDEYFAYQRKAEEHNHKVDWWEKNHMTDNSLLFLHCDPEMKAILKAHKN